ncbi:MAG: Holliday junction resolvase RuvX [Planctomycetota bacterium]
MTPMGRFPRVLAIDFGEARTGLAATDWTGTVTLPLGRIEGLDDRSLARAIARLVAERQAERVVLGMPLLRDGSAGARARRTGEFLRILEQELACPISTIDESHTTDEAHELLKQGGIKAARRKLLADSTAALVILRRYLESL